MQVRRFVGYSVVGFAMVFLVSCSAREDGGRPTSESSSATPVRATSSPTNARETGTAANSRTVPPATNPPPTVGPSGTSYSALLGKQFTSTEVSSFLNQNKCSPSNSHYLCYSAGMELTFDGANKLIAITLNRTRGDWKQYSGPLPEGLTWTDTKSSVDKKLGAPTSSIASVNGIRGSTLYKGGAITVTFDIANGDPGPNAVIYDIRVK